MSFEESASTTPVAGPHRAFRILSRAPAFRALSQLGHEGLFGAFQFDLVANTLSCSPEALRRFGLSPQDDSLCFEAVWERILPADRERVRRAAIEGTASGQFATVYRVLLPEGSLRWLETQARLQRTAEGLPLQWIGLILDASSALAAEMLQQDARDQVVELVESVSEAFLALDRDFRFTYVNQRILDGAHKSREELIGRCIWDVFPSAANSAFYTEYRRVNTERVRRSFLVQYVHPDGTESWLDVHAFPTAEGMAALVRNVTELKRAREAVEASEERFRRAQQAANIGAFEGDLATNRLTWAARVPTFTEVPEADDFSGYLRYVDDADRADVMAAVARVLAGGQHSIEVRIHPPDSRVLWFYFRAEAVFDERGKPTRVYGIAMDVTERKRAEEALRTSEKLAAAGRLAATIAHEINNPLAAVTNLLYLACQSVEPGSEARAHLSQAEAELQRVAGIVRQTLGFYRGTTVPARLEMGDLLRDALRLFERRFAAGNISLVQQIAASVPVLAIEGELRQIVANLIGNALDAVEPGRTVWVTLAIEAECARLEVRDNGRGIPPQVLERLFEPFFTTKQGTGTGLGLWVSRELARKNGGRIEVASEGEGHGSSFVLCLPLA